MMPAALPSRIPSGLPVPPASRPTLGRAGAGGAAAPGFFDDELVKHVEERSGHRERDRDSVRGPTSDAEEETRDAEETRQVDEERVSDGDETAGGDALSDAPWLASTATAPPTQEAGGPGNVQDAGASCDTPPSGDASQPCSATLSEEAPQAGETPEDTTLPDLSGPNRPPFWVEIQLGSPEAVGENLLPGESVVPTDAMNEGAVLLDLDSGAGAAVPPTDPAGSPASDGETAAALATRFEARGSHAHAGPEAGLTPDGHGGLVGAAVERRAANLAGPDQTGGATGLVSPSLGRDEAVTLPALPARVARLARGLGGAMPTEVRLRLDPPSLGEVRILIGAADGGVHVRIVAQSAEARALLAEGQPQLRDELQRHGLALESFSTSVGQQLGERQQEAERDRWETGARAPSLTPPELGTKTTTTRAPHPLAGSHRGLDQRV